MSHAYRRDPLTGLAEDLSYRTNIGFANLGSEDASVRLTVLGQNLGVTSGGPLAAYASIVDDATQHPIPVLAQ